MKIFSKFTSWYFSKNALPYWAVLLIDSALIYGAYLIALYRWEGGAFIAGNFWPYTDTVLFTLPVMWLFMKIFHTYAGIVRYSSFADLGKVALCWAVGFTTNFIVFEVIQHFRIIPELFTFEIVVSAFLISVFFSWAMRITIKYLYDQAAIDGTSSKVLIYGVRSGGIALAKSMKNEHPLKYVVAGFISPDANMVDRYIMGARVYPSDAEVVQKAIKEENIKSLFVSPLVTDEFRENDKLVNMLTREGVHIKMMPAEERWDGKSDFTHKQLHEVDIEDLLPRSQIQVDLDAIGKLLRDKCILVTGAAGSIGFELVKQVAKFHPSTLILIDQAETPMHDVRLFISRNYPYIKAPTIVSSICNQSHMETIFKEHKPEYVFHAAAYKHVPMMEDNPAIAVQNNIYGTRVIADLAVKYGTKKFVMISTDKAVNPTNVMGCSKRICEIYCQSLNKSIQDGTFTGTTFDGGKADTQFITTRFGNVLGSNGSVIPIFKEQIKAGGPLTVTHPDIIRFFMLIPEACQLILEAGTMGHGGEIFVFDMGKPVRIADLAQRMIDLSGATNVEIKFTGLRDGEKLYEEVLAAEESNVPTVHPKIMVAKVREYSYVEVLHNVEELCKMSKFYDDMEIVCKMKMIVPEYKSKQSKYEVLD